MRNKRIIERNIIMTPPAEDENIFRTIRVEPKNNCRGTITIIGGSNEPPEL